jgi:hypothetical protein
VAQLVKALRYNLEGSIHYGVIAIFRYGRGVDSNSNDYHEYFLGVKAAGA